MTGSDLQDLTVAVQALIYLVRDEWPESYSLIDIAVGGMASHEGVDAIRRLVAGELSIQIQDKSFYD